MSKVLCALQFFSGDWQEAREFVRLIGDLRDRPCEVADFMLVSRDCPSGSEWLEHLRWFDTVHTHICPSMPPARPAGCNAMFGQTWRKFLSQPQYDALFTLEADTVLLSRDWLERIVAEFRAAQTQRKLILGHQHWHIWQGNDQPHVNGTAVFAREFDQVAQYVGRFPDSPDHEAWDCRWGRLMLNWCQCSRLMYSDPGSATRWDGRFETLGNIWGEVPPPRHPYVGQKLDLVLKTGHQGASQAHAVIREALIHARI